MAANSNMVTIQVLDRIFFITSDSPKNQIIGVRTKVQKARPSPQSSSYCYAVPAMTDAPCRQEY
jgi:predicted RNA-binding protein with PUA-like domain